MQIHSNCICRLEVNPNESCHPDLFRIMLIGCLYCADSMESMK
jgi:hypothetical protein